MEGQEQGDQHHSQSEIVQQSLRRRYTVTLNAATTAGQNIGDPSTSYIDQDVVYRLSILDTNPRYDVVHEYHTTVWVRLNDESPQSSPSSSCSAWTALDNGFCTMRYSPYPQDSEGSPTLLPTLCSSSEVSFSVTWRSNVVTGGSYCLIPITFTNTKSAGDITLKLCAGTDRVPTIDANMPCGEGYEESFALIRLFSEGNAQARRVSDIRNVEQELGALDPAIRQTDVEVDERMLKQKNVAEGLVVGSNSKKRTSQKRKASSNDPVSSRTNRADFACGLSSVRPVQVFRPVSAVRGEIRAVHIPSQQQKRSKTPSLNSITLDHGKVKAGSSLVYNNGPASLGRTHFTLAEARAHKANTTAFKDESNPVTCFYVRPEHLPSASYRAIYLPQRSFPNLLYGISSKLQVDLSAIGDIFYYDEHKTQVVVSEMNIISLAHEQDLIVCLLWNGASVPVSSAQENHFSSLLNGIGGPSTDLTGIGISGIEQLLTNDQTNLFDDYLVFQPEEPCDTSVDSWGDFADDKTSISETFSRCSTGVTSMSPDDEVKVEEDHFQHQLVLGAQGLDHDKYGFIPLSNLPPQWLPSAPNPELPRLSSIDRRPAQVASLAVIKEHPNEVVEEMSGSATKSFPPGYISPVSRKYSKVRSARKRTSPALPASTHIDVDSNASKSKSDKDVRELERNRIAATKCRVSRRQREVQLQEQSRRCVQLNQDLKVEIRHLEVEKAEARALLEQHNSCDVFE